VKLVVLCVDIFTDDLSKVTYGQGEKECKHADNQVCLDALLQQKSLYIMYKHTQDGNFTSPVPHKLTKLIAPHAS